MMTRKMDSERTTSSTKRDIKMVRFFPSVKIERCKKEI